MIKRYAYNPDQAWSATDDGEWVRFEDHIEHLNTEPNGEINRLQEENKELKERVRKLETELADMTTALNSKEY